MKVHRLLTHRFFIHKHFWKIVYEWEDIISHELHMMKIPNMWGFSLLRGFSRHTFKSVRWLTYAKSPALSFVMCPGFDDENIAGRKNIIPIIIDFFCHTDEEFKAFERRYSSNPAVIITSREAFDVIKNRCPGLRIFHWALSLPDQWRAIENTKRRWDCAEVGRPNPVLHKWLLTYAEKHPKCSYIVNERRYDKKYNYVSSTGCNLGDVMKTRQSYFDFLTTVRVGLYSTPSMDDSRNLTNCNGSNGYNQVTPRFLEYIGSGCHVISRYPQNADTQYFELDKISHNIRTYEEFERQMDYALTHEIDHGRYNEYLNRHITTSRIKALKEILLAI